MLPILRYSSCSVGCSHQRTYQLTCRSRRSTRKKFIAKVEETLQNGGIEAAKEICHQHRGPIASIYYQGLDRYDQGLDAERLSFPCRFGPDRQMEWVCRDLPTLTALRPMLGFRGTVVGVTAFDAIQAAGDISPTLVAGVPVALLTTLMGLAGYSSAVLQLYRFGRSTLLRTIRREGSVHSR